MTRGSPRWSRAAMAVGLLACNGGEKHRLDEREPCDDHDPLRSVYFGDLHVHTRNSFDAWVYDVRTDPDDAYRFARGEEILLPPLDADGKGTRPAKLARPLDFAAVTDHAEYLGEVWGCSTAGSAVYETELCVGYREANAASIQRFGFQLTPVHPTRFPELCDGWDCLAQARDVWQHIQDAAEAAYDRTSRCAFTSFVAWEWSGTTDIATHHRNVIFRTATVPAQPTSYFEEPDPRGLWAALGADCLEEDGCDVLGIPHNSNQSNGHLFAVEYEPELDEGTAAADRAAREPVAEIYQHKGDSECSNGLSTPLGAPDELCDFEKIRALDDWEECEGLGSGGQANFGCVAPTDFLRGVFNQGLREEARVGANPFQLGVIASTDTHSGTPGNVDEDAYIGHLGNVEDTPQGRLAYPALNPGGVTDSGGGLAAIWAEENSRDSLFEALRRREVYGTSGPRIAVRMFAGWELDADLCDGGDLVARGYAQGVPMGGVLPTSSGSGAPTIAVSAARDPGTASHPGGMLERVQIVKGWLDATGEGHVEVVDAAGEAVPGVDLDTCAPPPGGAAQLCATWTDPDFDPALPAWYYARIVEVPSCRWSWRDCLALTVDDRPESCSDPLIPRTVRERAWTSPVWYAP